MKLQQGNTFGEYSFFTGFSRTATAVSVDYTKLFRIQRLEMLRIINPIFSERVKII